MASGIISIEASMAGNRSIVKSSVDRQGQCLLDYVNTVYQRVFFAAQPVHSNTNSDY